MGEKGEGIKKKMIVTEQPWVVKYRIKNIVSNSLITTYGIKWCKIY